MKRLLSFALLLVLTAPAFAGRAVARWDVVPDQVVDDTIKIGVVAFHIDGVQVEFRVNSTLVHTAQNPTYNDSTGVWEYWFTLDASNYSDGAVTIDAKCIAQNQTDPDYDLDSITMYANSGSTIGSSVEKWVDPVSGSDANDGSESYPYATLGYAINNTPAGGTIYLEAGTHTLGTCDKDRTRVYWTTICPADGVGRDDVIIATSMRPRNHRLKWQSISFIMNLASDSSVFLVGDSGRTSVWTDDCYFENTAGRWAGELGYFGNAFIAYVTGGESYGMADGPAARLIRDHDLNSIRSDAWTGGGKLVVNSAVYDIDAGTTGNHPDFHQSYSVAPDFTEDVILYNVRGLDCASQGLFGIRLRNAAFVNVLFERVVNSTALSQYEQVMENVLFAHITLDNQSWMWRGVGTQVYDPTDVNFVNSILPAMSFYEDAAPDSELVINYNHFSAGTPLGSNYTSGSVLYVDADNEDFHLQSSSPAAGSGVYLQCVPVDIDNNPYDASGRNRGCYSVGNCAPVADAGSDQTIHDTDANGSESVTLDGTGSSDSDGTITSYVWTENSTQIATGSSPNVTLSVGQHTIELSVSDNLGSIDTDTVVINVNALPVSDAGSDQVISDTDANGSESVTLDGSGSSDSDGIITSYVWTENSTQIATGSSPNVTLPIGEHTIVLSVTDDLGGTDTDTVVVDINAPPVADAGADQFVTDSDADGSAIVYLDATGSSDSDGTISGYAWSIDSTPVATGLTPSLTLDVGMYTIDLSVTDSDSLTDDDSVDVNVYSRSLTSVTGTHNWPVNVLPTMTGSVTVEFDAIANAASIDGVIGLASGAADWWNELAAIVRFNTSGYIDVRNGSSYSADLSVAYDTVTNFHFRMVLNITSRTYSVYVTPDGGSEQLLADSYGFRTEQLGVTSLDHWTLNSVVDTHTVSNLIITD